MYLEAFKDYQIFSRYKGRVFLLSSFHVIENLLEAAGISLFALLFQSLGGSLGEGSILVFLETFVNLFGLQVNVPNVLVLIVSFFIFKAAFSIFLRKAATQLSATFLKDHLAEGFEHLANIKYSALISINRGEVVQAFGEQIRKASLMIFWLLQLISSFINALVYVLLACAISIKLSSVTTALALAFYFLIKTYLRRSHDIGNAHVQISSELAKGSIEVLENLPLAKSMRLEHKLVESLKDSVNNLAENWGVYQFFSSSLVAAFQPLTVIVICSALYLGQMLEISLGELLLFLIAMQRVFPTMITAQNLINNINITLPSYRSFQSIINFLYENREVVNVSTFDDEVRTIQFDDVYFGYSSENDVFSGFSSTFEAGKIYGIVGASGTGKTTFISLLLGFFSPIKGSILVNGKRLQDLNLYSWRSRFSSALQGEFFLNSSIENNVAYFADFDKARFQVALDKASATGFYQSSERTGFSLNDSKTNLSGGQKQRISLSRCFYSSRDILIFDEPTSALDKDNEAKVMANIFLEKRPGRVIFIISHNESLLKDVDVLLRLKNRKFSTEA